LILRGIVSGDGFFDRSVAVTFGATGAASGSGNPFAHPAVDDRRHRSGGMRMTIRHQTWLADVVAGSALVFVLYFILLGFSRIRLP
jgi:hypothetical protein